MKFAAVGYTLFAALLAFCVGSIQSCIERHRRRAVEPAEVVIPSAEEKSLADELGVNVDQIQGRVNL